MGTRSVDWGARLHIGSTFLRRSGSDAFLPPPTLGTQRQELPAATAALAALIQRVFRSEKSFVLFPAI